MKFFKKKNLLNVLYAVLIALPLFSILGRVLYTQWNKNAYQSYSGSTQVSFTYDGASEIEVPPNFEQGVANFNMQNSYYYGNIITFSNFGSTYVEIPSGLSILTCINGKNEYQPLTHLKNQNTSLSWLKTTEGEMSVSQSASFGKTQLMFKITDLNNLLGTTFVANTKNVRFQLEYLSTTEIYIYLFDMVNLTKLQNILVLKIPTKIGYEISEQTYTSETTTLDSAFDYSISTFVSENDFGKLNFFTWFSGLFLSSNSVNTLYIHFVNWYLNYILYVSLGYILWLVLMWFVSFIRRLLEKTSTYETGGF